MPANPFKVFDLVKNKYMERDDLEPSDSMIVNGIRVDCAILNIFADNNYGVVNPFYGCQLFEVEYSDENDKLFPNVIKAKTSDRILEGSNMGLVKNTYWAFQQEARYKLVLESSQLDYQIKHNYMNRNVDELIIEAAECLPPYIDLQLSDKALEELEITLAPDFSEANKILIEALIKQCNLKVKIKDSLLNGLIR